MSAILSRPQFVNTPPYNTYAKAEPQPGKSITDMFTERIQLDSRPN